MKRLIVVLLFAVQAHADVDLGVGMTSVIGRYVPAASGAYVSDTWMMSGSTTGVRSSVYYVSAYTLAGYYSWKAGDFWWGPLYAGFGGGVGYSQRGYRNGTSASLSNDTDLNIGPAFRLTWMILGSCYVNFDAIWGVGIPSIELAGQDNVIFSIGWRL